MNQTKKPPLLLYLHGFNSSPQSFKAQAMLQYCHEHRPDIKVCVPQLPHFPQQTQAFLHDFMQTHLPHYHIGLVGSSLGGFLSTWIHHTYQDQQQLKAVLVNPAVKPHELLVNYLGQQQNMYTKELYVLEEKHIAQLKELYIEHMNQLEDFWVLLQTNDEVLDYQEAVSRYGEKQCLIEQGGDHSFIGFENYVQKIIEFLEL